MWSNITHSNDPNFISEFNLSSGVVLKQSALIYNPSVWHKIFVKNTLDYSRDYVLGKLMDTVHPIDFTPVSYWKENDYVSFLLKNCGAAINELCRLNLTVVHDEKNKTIPPFKIAIFLKFAHAKDLKIDIQANIVYVLKKRYNLATKTLNLDKFYKDPDLQEYCPLSQPKLMYFIMHISKELEVEVLKISNNGIRTLKPLEAYTFDVNSKQMRILKSVDARKNNIAELTEIAVLKSFQLTSLDLDENPICSKYFENEYLKHIRSLCPKLIKLDGCKISAPMGVLPLRRNFLCNLEGQGLVDQFLEHYFTLYDTNRSVLEGLYHKNAMFSINCMYNNQQPAISIGRRFNEYKKMSRNIKLISDLSKSDELLFYGSSNIIRALLLLPNCKHDPYSFTVDMSYYTGEVLVLNVSGVFKEPGQSLLDSEYLYAFSRTFVLKQCSNDEYNIINEMFHVSNASPTQINRAFKIVKVTPVKSVISVPDAKTSAEKEEMLEALVKITELKPEWARKCLIECSYDLKKSILLFTDLFKSERIPVEAFSFYVEKPVETRTITNIPQSYNHDLNIQTTYNQPYLPGPISQQTYNPPRPIQVPMSVQAPMPVQAPMSIMGIQPLPVGAPAPLHSPLHTQHPIPISPATYQPKPVPPINYQPKPVPKPVEAPKPVPPPISISKSNIVLQRNTNLTPNKNENSKTTKTNQMKNLITLNCSSKINNETIEIRKDEVETNKTESKPDLKTNNDSKNDLKITEKEKEKEVIHVKGVESKPLKVTYARAHVKPPPLKSADPAIRAAIALDPNATQDEAKKILEDALNVVITKHCYALNLYRAIGKEFYRHKLFTEARNMLTKVMKILNKVMGEEIYSTFTLYEIQFGNLNKAEEMVIETSKTFPSFKTVKLIGEHVAKINSGFSRKLFETVLKTDIDSEKQRLLLKKFKDFEIKFGTKETIEKVNLLSSEILTKMKNESLNKTKYEPPVQESVDKSSVVNVSNAPVEIIDLDALEEEEKKVVPKFEEIEKTLVIEDIAQVKCEETSKIEEEENRTSKIEVSSIFPGAEEIDALKGLRSKLYIISNVNAKKADDSRLEKLKDITEIPTLLEKADEMLRHRNFSLNYVKTICNILWNKKCYPNVREILVQSKNKIKNMHLRNLVIYYKIETDLTYNKAENAFTKLEAHLKMSNTLELFNFFNDLLAWNENFARQAFGYIDSKINLKREKTVIIYNIYKAFAFDTCDLELYNAADKKLSKFSDCESVPFHPDDVLSDPSISKFRDFYTSLSTIAFNDILQFINDNNRSFLSIIEACRACFYHKKLEDGRIFADKVSYTMSKKHANKYRIAQIMFEAEFGDFNLGYKRFESTVNPDINILCAAMCCLFKNKDIGQARKLLFTKLKTLYTVVQLNVQRSIFKYNKTWINNYNVNLFQTVS